ncbi:MAG: Gfo/Idh/MocA family oxidoreductase [archaeon]
MENKKINLLVVGLGNWAKSSLLMLKEHNIENIVDKCILISRSKKNTLFVKKLRLKIKHKIYTNLKLALYENNINAIYICTPDHLHIHFINKILKITKNKEKIHFLIEKPFGTNTNSIIQTMNKLGYTYKKGHFFPTMNAGFVMIDWHKKYSPQQKQLVHMIKNNNLGKLKSIRIRYLDKKMVLSKKFISWFKKTNVFSFLAGQYIDLIFHTFPDFVPKKMVVVAYKNRDGCITEATLCINIQHKIKLYSALVTMIVTCNEPDNNYTLTEQDIVFVFENAKIKIDTTGRDFELIDKTGISFINVHSRTGLTDAWENDFVTYGYTYESQKRWLYTVYNIINKNKTISESIKQYPISIFPEIIIEYCNRSLTKVKTKSNIIFGKISKIKI